MFEVNLLSRKDVKVHIAAVKTERFMRENAESFLWSSTKWNDAIVILSVLFCFLFIAVGCYYEMV